MITPTATYRLQFRNGMTFQDAAQLAPYLARLGISHLYAAPVFQAEPGSTHGYDVVDNRVIDSSLGGDEGFERMAAALRAEGIGIVLDFVPNHMSASTFNPYWRDVLEWGEASDCAQFFDIDWAAPKLLIPALGTSYGQALEEGKFGLHLDERDGGMTFTYYGLKLPLTPTSYAQVLMRAEGEDFAEWARRFAVATPQTSAELKSELAAAVVDPTTHSAIEQALAEVAADTEALHELHEMQIWRLTHWRAARETLTYRRFFEITDLVGIKVERPRVFDEMHVRLFELVEAGKIDGIRLDHIDGLADPKAYFERLQKTVGEVDPFYLLIEKILGPGEELRAEWPVAGTTGYEFIRALAELFTDPHGESGMTRAYCDFLQEEVDYEALILDAKRTMLIRNLAGELEHLKDVVGALAMRQLATRDFGNDTLRRAIIELAAALPVYRTYVDVSGAQDEDRAILAAAAEKAKAARQVEDEEAIDFLRRVLELDLESPEDQASALEFAVRFQQTTGPVMAKALEDTTFYRYNRLIALNEVGGEPDRFGAPLDDFHAAMAQRLRHQPAGLSTTSTHDTKRGEDSRARLYVLSEMPEAWAAAVHRWTALNAEFRRVSDDLVMPEPEVEWMFYQALAGAWPADLSCDDVDGLAALADRMAQFMLKAVREAKMHTSWTAQDTEYEAAVESFTRAALDPARAGLFLQNFTAMCGPVFLAGALNSLSQTAIKLTAPGVPDIYQGSELWELSLVDPDNRRAVDYDRCRSLQATVGDAAPDAVLADWRSGAVKMRLLHAGLALRARAHDLFAGGDYVKLAMEGAAAENVVAFARVSGTQAVVTIVPRTALNLLSGESTPLVPDERWGDTVVALPPNLAGQSWRDVVTGEVHSSQGHLSVGEALGRFPVAVLANEALQERS
ncbi:MAG TPA: malto-oligosyltrehalose synthase [Methyloceanibacter sp.]|nr:malto-oligosyltrehalose synthase [Methyloceanibacter sp.]